MQSKRREVINFLSSDIIQSLIYLCCEIGSFSFPTLPYFSLNFDCLLTSTNWIGMAVASIPTKDLVVQYLHFKVANILDTRITKNHSSKT